MDSLANFKPRRLVTFAAIERKISNYERQKTDESAFACNSSQQLAYSIPRHESSPSPCCCCCSAWLWLPGYQTSHTKYPTLGQTHVHAHATTATATCSITGTLISLVQPNRPAYDLWPATSDPCPHAACSMRHATCTAPMQPYEVVHPFRGSPILAQAVTGSCTQDILHAAHTGM